MSVGEAAVIDRPLIAYVRVSTSQQGRSGLGIEAQRQTLQHFSQAEGFTVVREFVEVETGKGADAMSYDPGCEEEESDADSSVPLAPPTPTPTLQQSNVVSKWCKTE